ncbi:MAG: hypothetical protein ACI845_002915 [Gammaproteobacteria bacterium]|jgi:hypothetical protein
MIKGSCLCGQIKFELDSKHLLASLCHCSICRKSSGAAFGSYGEILIDDIHWITDKDQLIQFNYSIMLSKYFCGQCGSTVATHHESWPEYWYISLGCLDGEPPISVEYHQFTGSQASWHEINDQLPQFPQWPDEI